jgi:3',5'-cyclic-AMP phosphodiesterase
MSGGVLSSSLVGQETPGNMQPEGEFTLVQISDTHIGFNKDANKEVTATLQKAVQRINDLSPAPNFSFTPAI